MTTTWYRIGRYSGNISEVQVDRESDRFVFIARPNQKTRRAAKTSEFSATRKTKEECFKWRVDEMTRDVESAKETLMSKRKLLGSAVKAAIAAGVEL